MVVNTTLFRNLIQALINKNNSEVFKNLKISKNWMKAVDIVQKCFFSG
jgi:hypothetical protein